MRRLFLSLLWLAFSVPVFAGNATATPAQVSRDGKALMPLVVSEKASPTVRALADSLAAGLGKITGGSFSVETSAAPRGIVVGTNEEWPGLLPAPQAGLSSNLTREDYFIRTTTDQVQIIGRTELGLQNGIWDFFYRAGFRQYFPGPKWEIWPKIPSFAPAFDVSESPSYYTRKLRIGATTWQENVPATEEWKRRNRMVSGFLLSSGHAYGRLIEQKKDFFDSHPKAVVGTGRNQKLDPCHPGVLEIAAAYAVEELSRNPKADSLSMEPSDGGGWRVPSALGSPSDQAVTLANHVANAIQEKFPGRKVGIYAYNQHSPAPTIRANSNLIVSVATSFIQGGKTADAIMKAWHDMGAEIGVREYWGVAAWDLALPGLSRASDPAIIARTIPLFYSAGARYWDGEVTDAWGVNGIGFFLTSRVLWDVREATRVPKLLEDFYTRSFGEAAAPMRDYFSRYVLKSGRPMLSEDLVGRMYRTLAEALEKSDSPEVTARIGDLVLYTRYVELMIAYKNNAGADRKAAYDAVAQLVWRGRGTFMFDRWTVFREIPQRQFKVQRTDLPKWAKPLLASEEPFTPTEINAMVQKGIAENHIVSFEPISYSSQLVPFPTVDSGTSRPPSLPLALRGSTELTIDFPPNTTSVEFELVGGTVRPLGPLQVRLFSDQNALVDQAVAEITVPADKALHPVRLESPFSGRHRLEIQDNSGGFVINWPAGRRLVLPASPQENCSLQSSWNAVFLVPADCEIVGGFSASPEGCLLDEKGRVVFDFHKMDGPGYFSVKVPPGQDLACWHIKGARGKKLLLTVPPWLARTPEELLVPAETLPF